MHATFFYNNTVTWNELHPLVHIMHTFVGLGGWVVIFSVRMSCRPHALVHRVRVYVRVRVRVCVYVPRIYVYMGYVPREGCMYFRGRSPRKYYY